MGQSKTKIGQDGNIENDEVNNQMLKARGRFMRKSVSFRRSSKLGKSKQPKVLNFSDDALFGETTSSSPKQSLDPAPLNEAKDGVPKDGNQQQDKNVEEVISIVKDITEAAPAPAPAPAPEPAANSAEVAEANGDSKEEEKVGHTEALELSRYAVNYEHVKEKIVEFTDSMQPTDEHSSMKLLDIFKTMKVTSEDCQAWKGDYGTTLASESDAQSKMKSVLEYAEKNSSCTPAVKTRLRCVTKIILEAGKDHYSDYKGIMLLIASHGNVCNVMKEVAINNAYGICTGRDTMADILKAQTLKEQVLRCLRDFRYVLVEEVFHFFKFTNNTHYIAGFHNTMAKDIGVPEYNDPNICYPSSGKKWKQGLDKRFFAEYYTLERIIKYVLVQIDDKKIGYQKVVKFFEDHCPPNKQKTDFLSEAIDIDTGKIRDNYVCFMLETMGVCQVKDDKWTPIEKCWV